MAPQNTPTPPRATRHARAAASPDPTMLRPFAIAGAVVVGAGLVVGTPTGLGQAPGAITARDVTLTAGDTGLPDLLTPWIDQYNTASENATKLMNTFFDAPGIGWQQFIANMSGYLQAFFNDPTSSTVATISHEMQNNLSAVLTGLPLQNATDNTTNTVKEHTLDAVGLANGHNQLFGQIPGYLPAGDASEITPIINFLGSPDSGVIMGMLGPEIAPWVALGNSISAGDHLNTTLANMVGAYFNGADLSLDSLLPTINGLGLFPTGMVMSNLDIGFGGLLSAGSVGRTHAFGDGTVGGSIFNSVGINFVGVPSVGYLNAPSQAVGPLGAWEGLSQTVAALLGWDGSGSPLATVGLPVVPTDSLDGGDAGSAAADMSTLWQDLVAAL